MQKKISTATVTWVTHENFGTYLQAYALQQALLALGYDNVILDEGRHVLGIKIKCLRLLKRFSAYGRSMRLYRNFKKRYLQIDYDVKNEKALGERYEVYITGSDQVWSPLFFIPFFFLDFTNRKKIAYAPSTGTAKFCPTYLKQAIPLMERYTAIALRETSAKNALQPHLNVHLQVAPDPTLLLPREHWLQFVTEASPQSEPYLLCYFLTPNTWYVNFAQLYAQQNGLRLVFFNTDKKYKTLANEVVDAGPEEFINYIAHAQRIFTDSFHGSIFCLHLQKEFVCFKRFADANGSNQNVRITDLFAALGIPEYFVDSNQLGRVGKLSKPCTQAVDQRLSTMRLEAQRYITNNINS